MKIKEIITPRGMKIRQGQKLILKLVLKKTFYLNGFREGDVVAVDYIDKEGIMVKNKDETFLYLQFPKVDEYLRRFKR